MEKEHTSIMSTSKSGANETEGDKSSSLSVSSFVCTSISATPHIEMKQCRRCGQLKARTDFTEKQFKKKLGCCTACGEVMASNYAWNVKYAESRGMLLKSKIASVFCWKCQQHKDPSMFVDNLFVMPLRTEKR